MLNANERDADPAVKWMSKKRTCTVRTTILQLVFCLSRIYAMLTRSSSRPSLLLTFCPTDEDFACIVEPVAVSHLNSPRPKWRSGFFSFV